jgi:uncharacterized protein (DUF2141 family)
MWGFIFAISTFAYAQEKFTVSGEIKFPKRKGEICVWLKTQEELKKWEEPASPARSVIIKPSPQQLKAKKVTFKFVNVPKGIYCIVCIQDLNKNGKMDYMDGVFAKNPIEPYGYSGPRLLAAGQWNDIKFEVDKDISGIEIRLSGS